MNTFEKIHIQGFRRLSDVHVELRPLNVVIGANGCGKTSLLDVFSLLAASASGRMNEAIGDLGGMDANLTNLLAVKGEKARFRSAVTGRMQRHGHAGPRSRPALTTDVSGGRSTRRCRSTTCHIPDARPAAACPARPGRASRPSRGRPASASRSSTPRRDPPPGRRPAPSVQAARSARIQSRACLRQRARSASLSLSASSPRPEPARMATRGAWSRTRVLWSSANWGRVARASAKNPAAAAYRLLIRHRSAKSRSSAASAALSLPPRTVGSRPSSASRRWQRCSSWITPGAGRDRGRAGRGRSGWRPAPRSRAPGRAAPGSGTGGPRRSRG